MAVSDPTCDQAILSKTQKTANRSILANLKRGARELTSGKVG